MIIFAGDLDTSSKSDKTTVKDGNNDSSEILTDARMGLRFRGGAEKNGLGDL